MCNDWHFLVALGPLHQKLNLTPETCPLLLFSTLIICPTIPHHSLPWCLFIQPVWSHWQGASGWWGKDFPGWRISRALWWAAEMLALPPGCSICCLSTCMWSLVHFCDMIATFPPSVLPFFPPFQMNPLRTWSFHITLASRLIFTLAIFVASVTAPICVGWGRLVQVYLCVLPLLYRHKYGHGHNPPGQKEKLGL